MKKRLLVGFVLLLAMTTLCGCGIVRDVVENVLGARQGTDYAISSAQQNRQDEGDGWVSMDAAPTLNSVERKVWNEVSDVEKPSGELSPSEDAGTDVAVLLAQKGSYRVIEERTTSCLMEIMAPDMRAVFSEAAANLQARDTVTLDTYDQEVELLLKDMAAILQREDVAYVTAQVNVELVDGEPVLSYEFYDALYGGLFTVMEEVAAAYEGGASE